MRGAKPRPESIRFPEELPISSHRQAIEAALAEHQTIIVCGETGSGKTTQLPKICLACGRGREALIGHTQPRRIAARAVATRIASELGSKIGRQVGYKMRFTDTTSADISIKVMTDGILLAEIRRDPQLRLYDTIILDEAHERSLNIDFLLGYLKRLLPTRPDLKLIITSATIDPEQFSRHFDGAPVIEVSGRSFPVEVLYRPLRDAHDRDRDLETGVLEAVEELRSLTEGDILVFLSGEREIRDCSRLLTRQLGRDWEILPLFARLSSTEQQKIFAEHAGRRVILATNIAETSLTVPGVRAVVDSGLARISRYSPRTKVQRLPIESISQASAQQRAGRCGRLGPGVCIRLYSEDDYAQRDEYTKAEILRTNLAAVLLQMKTMGLGEIGDFPFMEPPDTRSINDGLQLLQELGALDIERRATQLGRLLARFPVDPRIGRMLVAARDEGCLRQLLVLAAALSIQDPRERPAGKSEAAHDAHRHFEDPRSDFYALLGLWNDFESQRLALTRSQLRDYCQSSYLSFARMWEWRDVHRQLRSLCGGVRGFELEKRRTAVVVADEASYEPVHRALLAGLLTHVAQRQESESSYRGTGGKKIHLFPGSGVGGRPRWIVAASLIETTRLYARVCARVDPRWIEEVGRHLVSIEHFDPFWSQRHGRVMAHQRARIGGLVLRASGTAPYAPVDPQDCRRIFIEEALVTGKLKTRGRSLRHNLELLSSIAELEDKSRRRDIVAGEDSLLSFYAERIPADVLDLESFERWRQQAEKNDPHILRIGRDELMRRSADDVSAARFPDLWHQGDLELALRYRFDPGHPEDGVSVRVPLAVLSRVQPESFEWLVPGYLRDKVEALLRSLPKQLRKSLLPLAESADAFLDQQGTRRASLKTSLREFLIGRLGRQLPQTLWPETRWSPSLEMNFQIIGESDEVLTQGRDLEELRSQVATDARRHVGQQPRPAGLDRQGLTAWDFPELSSAIETPFQGMVVERFPALVDRLQSVDLQVLDQRSEATELSRRGVGRLLILALPEQVEIVTRAVTSHPFALRYLELPDAPAIRPPRRDATIESPADDLLLASMRALMPTSMPRTAADFAHLVQEVRGRLTSTADHLQDTAATLLDKAAELRRSVSRSVAPATRDDIEEQLSRLLYRGFVYFTPPPYLGHVERYLRGVEVRLAKARDSPERDLKRLSQIQSAWQRYWDRRFDGQLPDPHAEVCVKLRYLLEELRISVFSQEIKTAVPVSSKRIERLWQEIEQLPAG